MEELLKKEDGLTSWRFKLNRVLGQIMKLLQGAKESKEKCILSSVNGQICWEPAAKQSTADKESDSSKIVSSMRVDGYMQASMLHVDGIANFGCPVEINGRLTGKTLTLNEELILEGNGRTEKIYATTKGLTFGPVVIENSTIKIPSVVSLGSNATMVATSREFKIYGQACPLKLDIENGFAMFPYGTGTSKVVFEDGTITGLEYTGTSATTLRLKNKVSIFGIPFDGSESLSGKIKDCNGITLSKGSKISFLHGIGTFGAIWLECIGDVLSLNGKFNSQSLHVPAEHYAEWYPCSETMENGDIISLDFNSTKELYAKAKSDTGCPFGVVTTEYAMCIGTQDSKSYPVCNKGRVKAKVEGKVKRGDSLIVGSIDGVLRTMNSKDKAYKVWAVALEDSDKLDVKLVRVHII